MALTAAGNLGTSVRSPPTFESGSLARDPRFSSCASQSHSEGGHRTSAVAALLAAPLGVYVSSRKRWRRSQQGRGANSYALRFRVQRSASAEESKAVAVEDSDEDDVYRAATWTGHYPCQ